MTAALGRGLSEGALGGPESGRGPQMCAEGGVRQHGRNEVSSASAEHYSRRFWREQPNPGEGYNLDVH